MIGNLDYYDSANWLVKETVISKGDLLGIVNDKQD